LRLKVIREGFAETRFCWDQVTGTGLLGRGYWDRVTDASYRDRVAQTSLRAKFHRAYRVGLGSGQ